MEFKKDQKDANVLLAWYSPKLLVLDLKNTHGKFDSQWPSEGGPGAGDRCTNPNNPNYNPFGWPCINRGPS